MLKDLWSLLVSVVIVSLLVYGIYIGGWCYNVSLAYIILLAIINPLVTIMLSVPEACAKFPIKRVDSVWVDNVQVYVVMLVPFFVLVGMGYWIVASIFLFGIFWGLVNGYSKRNEYNRRLKENETKEEKASQQD